MNVLSLFDGMSCGRIALDRAGLSVGKYYASEIDSHAIKVTQANWPEIIQLGSVENWKEWGVNWASIDLLIGGSPCQGFSFAGDQLAFDDPRSKLFFVYVDILRHIRSRNPGVKFMLENVKMKKEYLDVISRVLEVDPILINSDKVSAQARQRYFWANWSIRQPVDRKVYLKDILQKEEEVDPVMYYGQKSIDYMMRGNEKWQQAGACRMDRYLQTTEKDKSFTLTANMHKGVPYNFCNFTQGGSPRYRKLTPIECERLQTVPDNYTNHVSNSQRYKMLGNGWTVDVIAHIFECISNASKENQQEEQLALAV